VNIPRQHEVETELRLICQTLESRAETVRTRQLVNRSPWETPEDGHRATHCVHGTGRSSSNKPRTEVLALPSAIDQVVVLRAGQWVPPRILIQKVITVCNGVISVRLDEGLVGYQLPNQKMCDSV